MMHKLHKVILLSILNIGCSLTQITHTGTATGTVTGINGAGTFTGTGTATGTGLSPVYSGTYTSTGTVTGVAPVANCDVAYVEDTIYEDDVCVEDTYDYVVEDIPLTPGYISDPLQTQSTILYLLQELIIRRDKLVDAYLNIGGDPTVLQGMYGIGTECNLFPYEDYAVAGPVVCDEGSLVPDVIVDNVQVVPEVVYDDFYAVPDVAYTDYAVPLLAPIDEVVSYDTVYDVPIAVPQVCEDVIEDTIIQEDPNFVAFNDGNGIYLGDGNANEDDLFQIGDNTCICMSEEVMQNFIASDVYSTLSDRGITGNPLLSLAGGQQVNLNGDCNGFFNLGSQECICYGNDVLTNLPAPVEECEFRFDYPNIQTPRKPSLPAPVSPPKEEVCEKPTEKYVQGPAPAPAPVPSPKEEVCEEPVQKPVKTPVKHPKQPVQEKPKQPVPVYPKAPSPAPAPKKDIPCEEEKKKPLMKKKKVLIPKKTAPAPAPQETQPTKDATTPAPKPSQPKVKKELVPKKPTPAEECVVPKEPQANPGSKKPTPMKKKKVAIPKPAPTECVEKEAPVKPGPAPTKMKKKIAAPKPDNKPSKPSKPVETPCTIRDLKKKGQENTAKKAAPAPAPVQPVPSRKSVAPPIVKKKPEEVCVETPAVPSRPGNTPSKPVATPSYPKPGSGVPSKPPAKKEEVCVDKPKTPAPVYPKPGPDVPSKPPGKAEEKCEDPSKTPTSQPPKSPTSTSPESPGKPEDKPCDADSIQKEAIQLFMKEKATSTKH
ncbi:hypothetical protein MP638_003623 [Amoeboaphelidium occidentale]|nr:hypothetical protein MP638_003623 [Amoeboaphelidium occidentale]